VRLGAPAPTLRRVFFVCFAVVFVGEWGDVTQITTATFVAHYHQSLIIGAGALAALWAVSALAVFGGSNRPGTLDPPGWWHRDAHRPGHLQPRAGCPRPDLADTREHIAGPARRRDAWSSRATTSQLAGRSPGMRRLNELTGEPVGLRRLA
jgi:hypothetical protein